MKTLSSTTLRIRELNDQFRTRQEVFGLLLSAGDLLISVGVAAHSGSFINKALDAVREFSVFNEDNDPHGEHDFGAINIDGESLFWKIDYYDRQRSYQYGSAHPEDATQTRRVLTLLLANEY